MDKQLHIDRCDTEEVCVCATKRETITGLAYRCELSLGKSIKNDL
jgi:hypothetical protein